MLMQFEKTKKQTIRDELIIEGGEESVYSEEYKLLTKDFYLNF